MVKEQITRELEDNLGLNHGFFESLLEEDDWAFVIKLHAFVDAACSELLLYHFKEPNLETTLTQIELGNIKTGKIVFLSKLGLITPEHKRAIQELSKLRNSFAHNVRDAHATLKGKFEKLDKQQKNNFLNAFPKEGAIAVRLMRNYHDFKKVPEIDPERIVEELNKEFDLKLQIWSSVLGLLIHFTDIKGFCDMRQQDKIRNT